MTTQHEGLTHDDLLVILARAMSIDDDEDADTIIRVKQRCKRFHDAIPLIVEKLGLERSN